MLFKEFGRFNVEILTNTQTFYCESCGTYGDMLKLASGYMDIPLTSLDELLETVVSRFGINRDSVTVDSSQKPTVNKQDLLSVEDYKFLNYGKDYFEIPVGFDTFEFENNEVEYWPVRYKKIYFRSLAMRDPAEHDWTICAITRTPWFILTTSCGMIELIEEHIVLATKGNKLIFKK